MTSIELNRGILNNLESGKSLGVTVFKNGEYQYAGDEEKRSVEDVHNLMNTLSLDRLKVSGFAAYKQIAGSYTYLTTISYSHDKVTISYQLVDDEYLLLEEITQRIKTYTSLMEQVLADLQRNGLGSNTPLAGITD